MPVSPQSTPAPAPEALTPEARQVLARQARLFADQIRWRWKLGRVDSIQDADGKPTALRGGFSGVTRIVRAEGASFLLKGWPAMSILDRSLGNLLEVLGAHGLRRIPLDAAERVRRSFARRRALVACGAHVPRFYDIGLPQVLVMEFMEGFESLGTTLERTLDPQRKLAALQAAATALRSLHDGQQHHGEPGGGNLLLRRDAVDSGNLHPAHDVSFIDFEWQFAPDVSLQDKQAFDLRYLALQQAARLVRLAWNAAAAEGQSGEELRQAEERAATQALQTAYGAYGAGPALARLRSLSRSGLAMFQESIGYMGISPARHMRIQRISDELLDAV